MMDERSVNFTYLSLTQTLRAAWVLFSPWCQDVVVQCYGVTLI